MTRSSTPVNSKTATHITTSTAGGVVLPDQTRTDLEKLGAQLGITAAF